MRLDLRPICRLVLPALLLAFGVLAGICPCGAQQLPARPSFLEKRFTAKTQKLSLAQAVALLQTRGKLNLLVDGEPVKEQAELEFDGTLADALDRIAEAFDYAWTPTRSGIVLLNKRFNSREEHPQISLPELRRIVRDVVGALDTVHYDSDLRKWPAQLETMALSLSPQQIQTLKDGKFLHGSDLTPMQFGLLEQAILGNTFGGQAQAWDTLAFVLDGLTHSYLVAKERLAGEGNSAGRQFDFMLVYRDHDDRLTSALQAIVQSTQVEIKAKP